jgi:hypothetical protein
METRTLQNPVFDTLRANPKAWTLFCVGLVIPFVNFGFTGYFGYPDWRHSWFDPYQVPLFILGFSCNLFAPLFVRFSWRRRLTLLLYSVGAHIVSFVLAMVITLFIFGPPID